MRFACQSFQYFLYFSAFYRVLVRVIVYVCWLPNVGVINDDDDDEIYETLLGRRDLYY